MRQEQPNKKIIRIGFKSFEFAFIEKAKNQILDISSHNFSPLEIKFFMLPLKKKHFTVLRSPHIYKKARDQFQLRTYKAFLTIESQRTLENKEIVVFFENIKSMLFFGVQLQIQLYTETEGPLLLS